MSNQLTCKDPFGYSPGLEDGNPLGPSPLSNSNNESWISGPGGIVSFSKTITIDSVFASFSLNQQGGNYSTSGYLYEIWIDGFINNGTDGNVLTSGHWIFLTNLLTLDTYNLVIVDTQDVTDPTEGNITKVLVADPSYSDALSAYVGLIDQGQEDYVVTSTPLVEYADKGIFPLENDIKRRINFNSKDPSAIINRPLLSYSEPGSLWIDSQESVLSYPWFSQGNSLRLERYDNRDSGFEVVINGTPSYRGQVSDETTNGFFLNMTSISVGAVIELEIESPYQHNYKKGDEVYVSGTMIDVRSGSYGTQYLRCTVVSFESATLRLMVTFKPLGASAAGTKWYVISEVNQINIPISANPYFSVLSSSEVLEYNLLAPVFSVRLQIEENRRFNRYVFRYKPDSSSSWKYIETEDLDTIIENVLPNTIFYEEIMGFNDSTDEYCGFSSSGTFNTFF